MHDALSKLAYLLEQRSSTAPVPERAIEASRLKGHVEEFLIPRFEDLDAPLLVVLLGSTGSGKSSLFNTLAAERLSEVGVLRPTTRVAQVLTRTGQQLPEAIVGMIEEGLAHVFERRSGREHLVVVDAPDFDSIEADNRSLARRLLEAADLVVFVTTDTRYADEVPWEILMRARQRGVPMLTIINRLPGSQADSEVIMADYKRLLRENGLEPGEVAGVGLGELDDQIDGLASSAIDPVRHALDLLVEDDAARRALVEESLEAAVNALPDQMRHIVQAIEIEAAARTNLLEVVDRYYEIHMSEIGAQIDRGTFLRSEVLREWQDFVGASKVARVIAEGIGKIAATIRSLFQGAPAVTAGEVREAALSDLTELVVSEADQAASSTAGVWSQRPFGDGAVASHPGLWTASPDLGERFDSKLDSWAARIGVEIMEMGERRAEVARAASLGVNVLGTGAILAVFAHTGGLTGAEAGIAAATAVVNQALLNAIFGEANVAKFVEDARARLDAIVASEMALEAERFGDALPIAAESADLGAEIKSVVERLRT